MHIGRALATALVGVGFMVFLSFDLVLFGAIALGSTVITVLLVVGLLGGAALGWVAGARKTRRMPPPPVSAAASTSLPPPAPM
ncbi:MAG: hypothetical protein WCI22_01230 [Actinomycetota bacterium]